MLEDKVDDKYYLSDKMIEKFFFKLQAKSYPFKPIEDTEKEIASCLTARYFKMAATDNYLSEKPKVIQLNKNEDWGKQPRQQNRIYSTEGLSPCLMSSSGGGLEPKIIQKPRGFNKGGEFDICPTITKNSWEENNHLKTDYKIRKLTPLECFRLQGFPDDFVKPVSNTQLYKQAGNAISVPVIQEIIKKII